MEDTGIYIKKNSRGLEKENSEELAIQYLKYLSFVRSFED